MHLAEDSPPTPSQSSAIVLKSVFYTETDSAAAYLLQLCRSVHQQVMLLHQELLAARIDEYQGTFDDVRSPNNKVSHSGVHCSEAGRLYKEMYIWNGEDMDREMDWLKDSCNPVEVDIALMSGRQRPYQHRTTMFNCPL